jgi:hypothetical protein
VLPAGPDVLSSASTSQRIDSGPEPVHTSFARNSRWSVLSRIVWSGSAESVRELSQMRKTNKPLLGAPKFQQNLS